MKQSSWFGLGYDYWQLGMESAAVMTLRAMKIAAGGAAAQAEASLMASEKAEALFALQTKAMTGGLGVNPHAAASRTLTHYRRKVRANRRRLAKA